MFTGQATTISRMTLTCRFLVFLILPLSLEGANRISLERQAASGDAEAQYQLAEALFWGIDGNQDLKLAAVWAEASARQGNAKGQYRIAVQLMMGQGVESNSENDRKGFEWLAKASVGLQKLVKQDDQDAQHKLALLYLSGMVKGGEDKPYNIDRKKAADLLEKSSNAGMTSSQYQLALIHQFGLSQDGRKQSKEKVLLWLQKAADNGSVYASYGMWTMFKQSQGRLVKLNDAKIYLTSSAEQGYAIAQYQYGVSLYEGLFGGVDQKAGIGWIKKAAEQGLGSAQLFFGTILTKGGIIDKNHDEAFFWLTLAKGSKTRMERNNAEQLLKQIRPGIKPGDRLDLLQRVRDYRPKESLATQNGYLGLAGAVPDKRLSIRLELFTALANKSNVAAMIYLGDAYRNFGRIKESIGWYEMAAKKDNKYACARLAPILLTGNGGRMEPDMSGGIKWLRKAAELGDVRSMNGLGEYIIKGEVKGVKPEKGMEWINKAAENGYALAQTNVGVWYINGDSVEQNIPEAKKWLLKAASQNFPRAQFYLGQYYIEGREEGKPNFNEALKWYRLAARQGEARALFALGMMHMDGMGVKKSFKEAYKWLEISKHYGMPGVEKTLTECAKELSQGEIRRAVGEAEQFRAQNYFDPNGSKAGAQPPTVRLEAKELEVNANYGDADAQFQLAQRYAAGDGVELDSVQAYKWFMLAQKSGYDKAKEAREKMIKARGMNIIQITSARKLVNDFRPKDK
ncbi:MAG: hypothetical protein QF685_10650 [Verrucomicrobiota bacterium]|jgi:hypothetical protein|nr:hypothetical protein [Verrucomicrobiota bacterium]